VCVVGGVVFVGWLGEELWVVVGGMGGWLGGGGGGWGGGGGERKGLVTLNRLPFSNGMSLYYFSILCDFACKSLTAMYM